MDFKIKKRELDTPEFNQLDMKIAQEFSKLMQKEMERFIKAIVVYGSKAKHTDTSKSDIDVLVIVDDVSVLLTRELSNAYHLLTKNVAKKISKRLHVNTLRLTSFWEYAKNGDPVVINMLRDGIAIYDQNMYVPLQIMLFQGRIRPTDESIWNYYSRSPTTILNSKWHLLQATIDLYWAVVDSAHAALMKGSVIPPSPEHVADLLEQRYAKKGKLEKKYPKVMRQFYNTMKGIIHRDIKEISGKEYDSLLSKAEDFINRMKRIIEHK